MLLSAPGAAVFDGGRKAELERLRGVLRSGRVQVRAGGMVRWDSDFSVFRQAGAANSAGALLIGSHLFDLPDPGSVPTLCGVLRELSALSRAAARFETLWAGGYDVAAVAEDMLDWLLG